MAKRVRRRAQKGRQKRFGKAVFNTGPSQIMKHSSGPVREVMEMYKKGTGNTLFRNMKTGEINISGMRPEEIAFWELRYPSMKYSKREMMERGLPDEYGIIRNNPVPRGEALRRAAELLKESDITLHIRYKSAPDYNVDIFFNSKKTQFFLLETNLNQRIIRKSITYAHKELAELAYHRRQVIWIKTIYIGAENAGGVVQT